MSRTNVAARSVGVDMISEAVAEHLEPRDWAGVGVDYVDIDSGTRVVGISICLRLFDDDFGPVAVYSTSDILGGITTNSWNC